MNIKAFFGFLGVVLLAIVLIVIAFNIGNNDDITDINDVAITEHVNGTSSTSYTVRGRIIALEEHTGYKITISQSERKIERYVGYDQKVIDSRIYPNTAEAYEEFIYALDRYNIDSSSDTDLRGICANGYLYEYDLFDDGERLVNEWTTTCGEGSRKKFNVAFLYEKQIPEYREFVSQIRL